MFKNAQPYMLQFHVKESHIHFWTFFFQKDGWLFSRIWRWFCKHGIKKRGDFVMVGRFHVCFFLIDSAWQCHFLWGFICYFEASFHVVYVCKWCNSLPSKLIFLPAELTQTPKNLVPCLFQVANPCLWLSCLCCMLFFVEARPHQLIRCPWKHIQSFLAPGSMFVSHA